MAIRSMTELRKELLVLFERVKEDDIPLAKATELNSAAGKIIGTVRTQLHYAMLRRETPEIEFLE